jgi:exonuclease VII small subunit
MYKIPPVPPVFFPPSSLPVPPILVRPLERGIMPLDVNDYEKIAAMISNVEQRLDASLSRVEGKLDTSIGRIEKKIDGLRSEAVPANVQAVINTNMHEEVSELEKRIEKLENTPGVWLMRLGIIFSIALSLFEIMTHVRLLP